MNKWLILVVLVGVIAVIYAFLSTDSFPIPGSFSFDEKFSELNQIWLSNGININDLENENIETISFSKLNSIESSILSFQSSLPNNSSNEVDALDKLALTHLDLVKLLKEKKALNEKVIALPDVAFLSGEEICNRLNVFSLMQSDSQTIYEKANSLEEKILLIQSSFSDLISESYADGIKPNADAIKQNLDESSRYISNLELLC